jgi:glycosyltransferase involved in cell wall biosynthesis
LRQDYTNKELIIVDDGTDAVRDLVPIHESIRYIRLKERSTVGAKRNLACENAQGSIIVHWDDDDWHAPNQLSYQVMSIIREGTDLCGNCTLLFYDIVNQRAWQYIYPNGPKQRMWLSGNTLCYRRSFWANNRFVNIDVGEDARFVWGSRRHRLTIFGDVSYLVGMIHNQNVSPKKTDGVLWRPYPIEGIRKLIGDDWEFYLHK